jgi:FkbM family methyltransferase
MAAPTFMSLLNAGATREQLEEWCRGKTQSYSAEGDRALVCRVLGKYLMFCATGDVALAPHLALDGIWEPWVTMAIARHVKPGMRCMDVGACYGYYSVLMSDIVGSAGRVQAWEPVWGAKLLANLNINGLDGEVKRALMGTRFGWFEYKIPSGPFNAGDIKLFPDKGLPGQSRVSMLPPAAEPWDFIKIDVEGAEADVWQALSGVRQESPNLTVCMEFTPSQHEYPDRFLSQLASEFEVGTVGHDGVPRRISLVEALVPDTGGFRMLWLTRAP